MLEIGNGGVVNSNSGLGADDRAGCAILWLLQDMGHSLLITSGEECGQVGSRYLMNNHPDIADEINSSHQFAVELDRRNGTDYKCYDVGTPEFMAYVEDQTGYGDAGRSSYTDICTLCRDITGVNLSVGYYLEHTENEHLVIAEWQHTLDLCRRWLGQKKLPKFALKPTAGRTLFAAPGGLVTR